MSSALTVVVPLRAGPQTIMGLSFIPISNLDPVAQNYSDYRPRYPQRLIEDLRQRTVGDHGVRFVDWGCGTGELTLPLSESFDHVTAIDLSPQMIAVAKANAQERAAANIEWLTGRAEDLEIAPDSCQLISAASSFHWMDRELLVRRAFQGLQHGGALAIVGGGGGGGVRKGDAEWHVIAAECLKRHFGGMRFSKPKEASRPPKSNAELLTAVGFHIEEFDYPTDFSWQIDDVLGYLYSIRFAPLNAASSKRQAFEDDLRQALSRANPSGVFHQSLDFYLTIAHKS